MSKLSKSGKISVISAISIAVGSTIGAGLFIKNAEILGNTQGNLILVCLCWIISLVGILALALTLAEICSGEKTKDSGVISWVKTFNSKFTYVSCRNFMSYIYLPTNFFIMPLFALQQFCLAIGWSCPWYLVGIISLCITLWFTIVSGLSAKSTNIQNWIVMAVKFVPIVFALIIGYIFLGVGNPIPDHTISTLDPFIKLSPYLGLLMSIPSIIFIFDGFYACTAIQTSMKRPEKMPTAMMAGLIIVATISFLMSASLLLSTSNGSMDDYGTNGFIPNWLYKTLEAMISIGILGVINGLALYGVKYYEILIKNDEIIFSKFFKKKKFKHIGVMYSLFIYISVFIICFLGGMFFLKTSSDNIPGGGIYNDNIYSLANIIGNWTSLFVFAAIGFSAFGCLKNRKTNKIKVKRTKYFIPSAFIAFIVIFASVLFAIANAVGDVIITGTDPQYVFYDDTGKNPCLLGSLMDLLFLLLIFCIIYFEPIKKKIQKRF